MNYSYNDTPVCWKLKELHSQLNLHSQVPLTSGMNLGGRSPEHSEAKQDSSFSMAEGVLKHGMKILTSNDSQRIFLEFIIKNIMKN